MKLLQNKAVVGGIAAVAFGVMAYNIGEPIYRRSHPKRPAAAASKTAAPVGLPATPTAASGGVAATPAAATPVAGAATVVALSATPASPGSSVDRAFYITRFPEWVQSPPLDPFTPPPAPAPETPKGPSAVDVLKLQGTWRQTGSMVAVINLLPLIEGEIVDGFTVNRIEADRVLVAGPRGVEEIRFAGDPGASAFAPASKPLQQASLKQP